MESSKSHTLFFLPLTLLLLSHPLATSFSQAPTPSPPSSETHRATAARTTGGAHLRRVVLGVLAGSLTGFSASLVFLLLLRLFLLYATRAPILKGPVVFSPSISPKTLQLALQSDPAAAGLQLLGSSPSGGGKCYKLVLSGDLAVAVKKLEPPPSHRSSGGPTPSNSYKRRVQQELEALARVKHRNVMNLRAYYAPDSHDSQFALVYDYIAGGSLDDAMRRARAQEAELGWEVRHRIAVGVAKGLRYLHFECSPRILHYRLRPSNVMLEEGFEPRLGDCGLATLMPPCLDVAGSAHFVAPECLQSCRYTDKSDIYSFGMIIAVLLTGKDPLDPFFSTEEGRGSFCRWLRYLQQASEAQEALDKSLLGEEVEEEEMLMAIRIALVCLSDLPADRPSSDELVAMLTQLHSF